MKIWTAGLVLALGLVPVAHADDATKQAKVHELFATMHMERTMEQMTGLIQAQVQQMVQSVPGADQMTPEQKRLTDDFMANSMKVALDGVGWKALEPEYTTLYANTYSESEIDGILTFYKSPAGQAMLAKTPELASGSMQIVQRRMVDLQPKIKAMQDEYLEKMRATGPR